MLLRQQLLLLQQPFVCALARLIEPLQFIAELLYHAHLNISFSQHMRAARVAFAYRAAIILHDLPCRDCRARSHVARMCALAPDDADAITDAENQGRSALFDMEIVSRVKRPTDSPENCIYVDNAHGTRR
jgi:hypothetical protein